MICAAQIEKSQRTLPVRSLRLNLLKPTNSKKDSKTYGEIIMAELRLMKNDDIAECVELYMGAFPHEGELGEEFRAELPPYFESYIANDYCMAYVLEDRLIDRRCYPRYRGNQYLYRYRRCFARLPA